MLFKMKVQKCLCGFGLYIIHQLSLLIIHISLFLRLHNHKFYFNIPWALSHSLEENRNVINNKVLSFTNKTNSERPENIYMYAPCIKIVNTYSILK